MEKVVVEVGKVHVVNPTDPASCRRQDLGFRHDPKNGVTVVPSIVGPDTFV